MKIWPFDVVADETGGNWIIARRDIERGLEPFRLIRDALGDEMEVALELHGRWNLPSAMRIARAIEPYEPMWIEDPIRMDNIDVLADFVRSTRIPTVASENLGSPFPYRDLLERVGVGIIMTDPSWDGGITVARKVADLAALYLRPFTPHDCSGPVTLAVGVHLCLHAENALVQEMVRAFYFGWYDEVVSGLPVFTAGRLRAAEGPGHGVAIRPEVREWDDLVGAHVACPEPPAARQALGRHRLGVRRTIRRGRTGTAGARYGAMAGSSSRWRISVSIVARPCRTCWAAPSASPARTRSTRPSRMLSSRSQVSSNWCMNTFS